MSGNVRSAQPDEFGERVGQLHCQCSRLLSAADGFSLLLLCHHVAPGNAGNCSDGRLCRVVQYFGIEVVCFGANYGSTAAPRCVSMRSRLRRLCASDCVLGMPFSMRHRHHCKDSLFCNFR